MIRQRTTKRRLWARVSTASIVALTLIGFLIITLSFRSDRPAQLRPIAVATGEWEPFVGSSLPEGGPVAQIMREVLASSGYDAQLDFLTWAQADQRVEEGSAFGGFPLVLSQSRSERMLASEPIFSAQYVLFTRANDELAPENASDLGQLRVGGVSGYDYWPELDDAVGELQRYDSIAEGFDALLRDEIDVFAEGKDPARVLLADPTLSFDESHFEVVASTEAWARSTQDLVFMMPQTRESERALERINESLAEFKSSYDYRTLIESVEGDSREPDRVVIAGTTNPATVYQEDGSVLGLTPRGTTGQVQEWPVGFRGGPGESGESGESGGPGELGEPGDLSDASLRVRVKFDSGPFSGRIVWVDAEFVEVSK